jgi:hypothetical protein
MPVSPSSPSKYFTASQAAVLTSLADELLGIQGLEKVTIHPILGALRLGWRASFFPPQAPETERRIRGQLKDNGFMSATIDRSNRVVILGYYSLYHWDFYAYGDNLDSWLRTQRYHRAKRLGDRWCYLFL